MEVEQLHHAELKFIGFLHHARSPFSDWFIQLFDFFDRQEFILILVPAVWLGYNWKQGARIFYILVFNAFINYLLKAFFALPRPFHLHENLAVIHVDGYGFPSGAAQSALLLSGILISQWKTKWAWIIAANFIFWVSFSRIYLGVHFPTDVLGGWIVGSLMLVIYLKAFPLIESALQHPSFWKKTGIILGIPFMCLIIFYHTPILRLAAATLGVGLGIILSQQYGLTLNSIKSEKNRIERMAIGIFGIFLVYGISSYLPITELNLKIMLQFVLVGLWLSVGAHFLCLKTFERQAYH